MKEENRENIANCIGTVKQFPGFLCSKNENIFECFIKINAEKGVLEGDSDDLCERRSSIAQKTPLTARRIHSVDATIAFRLIGNTARILYDNMTIKPIHNNPNSCLGGFVKQLDGLGCSKYKEQYYCDLEIDLRVKYHRQSRWLGW
jgi:hypothetical protein